MSRKLVKDIDIINGWNENDGSIFIQPNNDAYVDHLVSNPTALDTHMANTLLSLYQLSQYAPQRSGNNTATAQFFRASQTYRDTRSSDRQGF